jgi:ABC-2 type transport system ATP-binding protein
MGSNIRTLLMNAVEITRVTKAYGKTVAVRDLNLAIPTGSIFGLIGPNGSGKTTTMRMILNIIYPDAGTIRVFDTERRGPRLSDMGYLPEERGLYRKMKVRDLLLFFSELRTGRPDASDADRWLETFELSAWSRATIESLSKGMSQKVQFIAAVVSRPRLVVMDEPFSGLDPVNFEIMKSAVLGLRDAGTTVILSTHDMALAESLCDRLCMVHKGSKVLDGTPEGIRSAHGSELVRFESAEAAQLSRPLPGVKLTQRIGSVSELTLEPGADPQRVLAELMKQVRVVRFEVARPSLHDIFVRIVRDEQRGAADA